MNALYRFGTVSIWLLLLSGVALAQFGTGTILGRVIDPSGAAVPGVAITLKSLATNETRTVETSDDGFYRLSALLSGTYTISASKPSFRIATVSNVVLTVSTEVRVDITMQLGSVSESVEVADTTPQLQTSTASSAP
ncbi:MAG TPA: carboxypeptidase-like regulatory domain-containing protein [Bryobacteraceae bacterium]|nr:carboxypeptidase-like regulatory domain-containing protein [Bryobacteraceae bacterium]